MAIQEKQVATELSALKRRFNPELYDFLVRLKEKADKNAKDIQDLVVSVQSGEEVENALLTTKGDILAHDGSAQGRFPVGDAANGYIITRDSGAPFGMRWRPSEAGSLPVGSFWDYDDFAHGADTYGDGTTADLSFNGSIANGWFQNNSSGDKAWTVFGFPDTEAEIADHPGIMYLAATNDVSDTFVTIQRGRSNSGLATALCSSDASFHYRAVVNAYQVQTGTGTANTSMYQTFGLAFGGSGFSGDGGLGFSYNRAFNEPITALPPTHWHVLHGDINTEADIEHTSNTVDTSWHLFEIIHNGATTIYTFKIDGIQVAEVDFDYETYFGTKAMVPFFSLFESSGGTGGKNMALDRYDLLITGMGRY